MVDKGLYSFQYKVTTRNKKHQILNKMNEKKEEKRIRKNRQGVSLIETLVSLIVLGVLLGLSVPLLSQYYQESKSEFFLKRIQAITYKLMARSNQQWQDSAIFFLNKEDCQFFFKDSVKGLYGVVPVIGNIGEGDQVWGQWKELGNEKWQGSFFDNKINLKMKGKNRLVSSRVYRFYVGQWETPLIGSDLYETGGKWKLLFYPRGTKLLKL